MPNAAADIRPKGLLAFLYNAVYDPYTNELCHSDLAGAMKFFGLSPDIQTAITDAQNAGQPVDSVLEPILNALEDELKQDYKIIW